VINEPKGKKDIENKRFFYRTFASKDANIRKWYSDTLGMRLRQRGSFKYTVLERFMPVTYVKGERNMLLLLQLR